MTLYNDMRSRLSNDIFNYEQTTTSMLLDDQALPTDKKSVEALLMALKGWVDAVVHLTPAKSMEFKVKELDIGGHPTAVDSWNKTMANLTKLCKLNDIDLDRSLIP